VTIGEHVQMSMRDAPVVDLANRVGKPAIAESPRVHQVPQRFAERLVALVSYGQ
jgi:hypothetical protein